MLNVVSVLKSGGDFLPKHVDRLAGQVADWLRLPHHMWVLTDYPPLSFHGDVNVVSLKRNWPGWWSKLELFDHFHSAFYLDLDTTVVGDLSKLVTDRDGFYAIHDLDVRNKPGQFASGVMRWRGDYSFLTRRFALAADEFMRVYRSPQHWGDQGFIRNVLQQEGIEWKPLQAEAPGAIASYKLDQQTRETVLVCHHGKPRPWEVK
jgi:hypothetical protein